MLLDRIIHFSADLLELQSWLGNSTPTYQNQLWSFISMGQLKNIDCNISLLSIAFLLQQQDNNCGLKEAAHSCTHPKNRSIITLAKPLQNIAGVLVSRLRRNRGNKDQAGDISSESLI